MYPVTVLLNVLGQLLVFLPSCSSKIVFMQMYILLYYWANKMMMTMMMIPVTRQLNSKLNVKI